VPHIPAVRAESVAEPNDCLMAVGVSTPPDRHRQQSLLCCLLSPTLDFCFLHIAVVPEWSVYDCNGSNCYSRPFGFIARKPPLKALCP
jgi:hypothetical protein